MMHAGYYERLGDPREIVEVGSVPVPRPGAGEVLVRIHVSGINPSDLKRATGWAGAPMAHPRVIPNNDGAGVIDAIGDGLPATLIGQRVWVYEATLVGQKQGTAAQYCAVPAEYAIPLPENADFSFGACLGVPAMTAHRAVFSEGPVEGKTVLVAGGAGSVGRFAVQFAAWGGAYVIATAGSPEKAEIAREAGADEVFLYTDPDLAGKIMACAAATPAGGVSHVVEVDFRDNIALDATVLDTNGSVSLYGSSGDPDEQPVVPMRDLLRKGINLRWVMVYALDRQARAAALRDIERAIIEGGITPLVAARYSLDDLAGAMAAVGVAGTGGKVLVDID
ncbi:MAG: NADPH:quinone reductase [Hyphomicrobiales bacterium]|nr:NADPH:quinone reductase [Hyphomicrobiales bacterium]